MPRIDLPSELLNFIADEGYNPGDRLPTISQLQDEDRLGISISKIREQLEVARALGLVEVRSKTGMRMKTYSFAPAVRLSLLFALAQDVQQFELFSSLRYHVEVGYWNEACSTLTGEDKLAMRDYIAAARSKLSEARWIQIPHQEHRAFHLRVFEKLENPFVLGLLEAYWDAYEAVELNRYADYSYLQQVWDYHERILDCICQEEFDEAKAAFVEHTTLIRFQPRMREVARPASDEDNAEG